MRTTYHRCSFTVRSYLPRVVAIVCIAVLSIVMSYGQDHLFPSVPKLTMKQDSIVYDSNNLWDIIDGAADLYLQYGFVDLRIARYSRADGLEIKAEVYRHNSKTNAFGIYSQERDTVYNFIHIGVQGYLQTGVLNFLSGVYYVKLSTHQVGKKAHEALLTVGRKIEDHLKQDSSWPDIVTMFPAAGKLPNTEQFVAKDFLGLKFLNSAFVATYRVGVPFRMFIIDATTPESASAISEQYVRTIPTNAVRKVIEGRYEISDPRNGMVQLAIVRHFLCGVIDCKDMQIAEKRLAELIAKLPK